MPADTTEDLVVLSHLRWTFVWQRPQHIVSRLARRRRTWFVEEPWPTAVDRPRLCQEQHGDVTRVWLEVPRSVHERNSGEPGPASFDDERAGGYADELAALVGTSSDRLVWLYTPVALPFVAALRPSTLAYDVMDDLASFAWGPDSLKLLHRQALRNADVVFAGGRSLHRGVAQHRPDGSHLFPSGVEPEHFAAAQSLRRPHRRPVAGYVGVIDERLDLDLVADLAAALPDWDIQMVGPVVKIDAASLPQAPNLAYQGPKPYGDLPAVLAGFDVALMPFALNAATRSISPTKTLEYLAAGLPVVSTRVPDVVADHSPVVELAAALPDWEIEIVGPVVKIAPKSLPQAPNLAYHGPKPYRDLPAVLAGFDVALMPFALNAATRSISPTKTLEYLAAGLPVVSTRVPDVVADHSAVLDLADDGAGFAEACPRVARGQSGSRLRAAETLLRLQHWDSIVERMSALVESAGQAREYSA